MRLRVARKIMYGPCEQPNYRVLVACRKLDRAITRRRHQGSFAGWVKEVAPPCRWVTWANVAPSAPPVAR